MSDHPLSCLPPNTESQRSAIDETEGSKRSVCALVLHVSVLDTALWAFMAPSLEQSTPSPFMLYLTLGSFTRTFISVFLYSSERPTPSSHFSCGQSLCLVFKTFPAHTPLKQFLCHSSNHSLTPLSSIDGGTVILQETTSITTTDNSVQFYLILFIQHQLTTQSPQDALYFKLKMLQY